MTPDKRSQKTPRRWPSWDKVAVFLAVLLTAYAAFSSQLASNRVIDLQKDRSREERCTSSVLFSALGALDDRYRFAADQAQANIDLQKAQADLLRKSVAGAHLNQQQSQRALANYFNALTHFVTAAGRNSVNPDKSPYPTPEEYAACLEKARDH